MRFVILLHQTNIDMSNSNLPKRLIFAGVVFTVIFFAVESYLFTHYAPGFVRRVSSVMDGLYVAGLVVLLILYINSHRKQ